MIENLLSEESYNSRGFSRDGPRTQRDSSTQQPRFQDRNQSWNGQNDNSYRNQGSDNVTSNSSDFQNRYNNSHEKSNYQNYNSGNSAPPADDFVPIDWDNVYAESVSSLPLFSIYYFYYEAYKYNNNDLNLNLG